MRPSSLFQGARWRLWFAGIALGLACIGASAQKPPDITAGEMALLPEYCPDTQTMSATDPRGSEKAARWVSILGNAFWGLHHYCWGLIHVSRANQAGKSALARRGHLESAINDYRYVLANSQPDFILLPELYLRIGEAQMELLAYASAMESFRRSREIKPDYWPPYLRAATVLTRLGKNADALAMLQEGMTRMPTERALIDAYKRMGGNYAKFAQTLPAPAAASAPTPTAAASSP